MRLHSVHHVQIMVPALLESEAREFYCGTLGLNEILKPEALQNNGGFWLELSGFQIHIGLTTEARPKNAREHVAFVVDSLNHWRKELHRSGIETKEGNSIKGFRRFEFRDPFANRIEFLERTTD